MTNNDEMALKMKAAAEKSVDNFDPNMFILTRDMVSLLAERDADKKRIAELEAELEDYHKRLVWMINNAHEWERKAINNFEECGNMSQRIAELEARTVSVKLPSKHNNSGFVTDGIYNKGIDDCYLAFMEACAAAGINLEVGD